MNREEALDVALGQIERQFGKGSVMRMSDQAQVAVGAVSTGSLSLDMALGIGGLPRGRVVEVFGPESSGKTTLVYHVIAEAQRRGGICAFIDAEHAMDPQYARRIGVNIDDLLVSQPDTGEQALEICELLVRSGAVDVVAIDSVAALTPKAEIEGEMGDSHVGLQARLMSQALRKLAGTLNRTDTICLFTNQLREKIGVMFGSPETTPGGRALKFYASVRLDIRRIETLKDGAEAYGNRVRVKVVKNKVAPPFKQAEFDIIYGSGISWEGTVLDVGIERKVVQKAGSYFSFGDERLGQGRQNATAFLGEHPDLVQQILARIQAEAPPEQVVSARLLPQAEGVADVEVTPIEDEASVEEEVRSRPRLEAWRTGTPVSAMPRRRNARRHRPSRSREGPRRDRSRRPALACRAARGGLRGAPRGRRRARPGDGAGARARAAAARGAGAVALRALRAATTRPPRSSSGSQTEGRRRPCGARRSRRCSGPGSSTIAGSPATGQPCSRRRGAGDLLIADDLERHGVPDGGTSAMALGAARARVERAARIIAARGRDARDSPLTWRPRASRRRRSRRSLRIWPPTR